MEFDTDDLHWITPAGSQALQIYQDATVERQRIFDEILAFRDRLFARLGLPDFDCFRLHQADGVVGEEPIRAITLYGTRLSILAAIAVHGRGAWCKHQTSRDKEHPHEVRSRVRGPVAEAIAELGKGVPSELPGIGDLLYRAANPSDKVVFGLRFKHPGLVHLDDGAIFSTESAWSDWNGVLEAWGCQQIPADEAVRLAMAQARRDEEAARAAV